VARIAGDDGQAREFREARVGLVTPVEAVPLGELGRVHFAAIGGAGMSGIAHVMLSRGVPVSGCDSAESAQLESLARAGARVVVGHSAEHLRTADTLVVSTAIRADNPDLAEARRIGIRVLHRAGALASLMLGRQAIAIAGTHGKTTTTSMVTTVLRHCGADPSYVIGGILAESGSGAGDGSGRAFVAEADESDGSFLMLTPDAAVVTSVEADHLDNYGSLEEIEAAFTAFARRIRPPGLLVTCADDPGAARLASTVAAAGSAAMPRLISYGASAAGDYVLTNVTTAGTACEFELAARGRSVQAGRLAAPARLRLQVPGRHNALNAAAAYAVCIELGFDAAQVAVGLARYQGAKRRMELKGEADGVRVFDSYAHHPTEITADLAAARNIADGGRVITIFQPHLFSRTRIFASQFGAALGRADEIFVLDVYAAREDPEPGVTGALIADAVPGRRGVFHPDLRTLPGIVAGLAKPGDVVLTMGAGDITALGPVLLDALRGDEVPG